MTVWVLWAFLLLGGQAAQTWVSRARNSKSLTYHTFASVFSHGFWIFSLGFAVNKLDEAWKAPTIWPLVLTSTFYVACCVTGSVGMHHILMTKVERGNRSVG